MSMEPVTTAEAEALSKLGPRFDIYEEGDEPGPSVLAYRAGFRDGRKAPVIFRAGYPEPGPDVRYVLDDEEGTWCRSPLGGGWWTNGLCDVQWSQLPDVVAVPVDRYLAALRGAQ